MNPPVSVEGSIPILMHSRVGGTESQKVADSWIGITILQLGNPTILVKTERQLLLLLLLRSTDSRLDKIFLDVCYWTQPSW